MPLAANIQRFWVLQNDFQKSGGGNENLEKLLSKVQINGLWGAYTVRFDWYDNVGQPGIFGGFSFLLSQLDLTPPKWYYVSVGEIPKGDDITVMTTEDAKVYLVPEGTVPEISLIKEAAIAEIEVLAYEQAKIFTSELSAGDYIAYAIDSSNNISEASRFIRLQTPVNTSSISNSSEITITYNSSSEWIKVKSTKELKQIEVYNILGKKIGSEKCHGKEFNFHSSGIFSGIYFVKVIGKSGTLCIKKIILK